MFSTAMKPKGAGLNYTDGRQSLSSGTKAGLSHRLHKASVELYPFSVYADSKK